MTAPRKTDVAGEPHDPARRAAGPPAASGPRSGPRRVVRVQHGRCAEDDDREERVLGHLQEDVHGAAGWAIRHGAGSGATAGHQNSRAAPRNSSVLQVVDERVLQRRVEQRREVADPHHRGEDEPGHDREGDDAHDPRVEHGQDPAPADPGEVATRSSSVTGAARARSGAATSTSRMCWTMWTENSVVS